MSLPNETITQMIKEDSSFGMKVTVNPLLAIFLEFLGSFFLVLIYYKILLEKNSLKFSGGIAMGAIHFLLF